MKRRSYRLGKVAGVEIKAKQGMGISSLILWFLFSLLGWYLLALSPLAALVGGVAAVVLHWGGELWHQLGHAWMARQSGYPMSAILLNWFLGVSLYPRNEPVLPAEIHIRRALGGPLASASLTLLSGVAVLMLSSEAGLVWWLARFVFVENLFLFTLGAFLPLGFTDGSTLLYWWPRRDR